MTRRQNVSNVVPRMMVLSAVRRFVGFVAAALVVALCAGAVAGYLAIQGLNLSLLRRAASFVGTLTAGQRVERLKLDVNANPATSELSVTATVNVRATAGERSRLYFLLNDGLRIRSAQRTLNSGVSVPLRTYQAAVLAVVVLDPPLQKDETTELVFDYAGKLDLTRLGEAGDRSGKEFILGPEAFWYPLDGESFFDADVQVTTPKPFVVAYNGVPIDESERGLLRRVHWRSERPVSGLSLIAGDYRLDEREADGVTLRLYQASDVQLDTNATLDRMERARQLLVERLGPSGFRRTTIFATRAIRRGFNDGTGLIGLSLRYFRQSDQGFALIAHEMAHDWWGGTVAGHWLSGQSGGQWIVEGMAEFSSLAVAETEYGPRAMQQRLPQEFFDPQRQRAVSSMTVLDNLLDEEVARDTIYRKGSYVATLLRRQLGDDAMFQGLREFLQKHRFSHATDGELQAALEGDTPGKLEPFFADWLRSAKLLDLSIEPKSPSEVTIANLGKVTAPAAVDVLITFKDGAEPEHRTVAVGDTLGIDANTASISLDPQLIWPDVTRENNRFPRREDPLALAVSAKGTIAVARGSLLPWERAAIDLPSGDPSQRHSWTLERGLVQVPTWDAGGQALVASVSDPDAPWPSIVVLSSTGARRELGHGTSPAITPNGEVWAGQGDKLVHFDAQGVAEPIVQRARRVLDQPWPSPDGEAVAYTSSLGNSLDLRLRSHGDDRVLLSWDRDRLSCRWATDAKRLYCLIGGQADWQIWEIAIDGSAVRVLVREATAIGDLAVSPDGKRLAFTAAEQSSYPETRRELYVLQLDTRSVATFDAPAQDLSRLVWNGDDQILVIASEAEPLSYPARRSVLALSPSEGHFVEWTAH